MRRLFAECAVPPSRALAALSAVMISSRTFIQGGPGPQKEDRQRIRNLTRSHEDEMKTAHRQKMERIAAYYAAKHPDAPAPLPENTFIKGQFGMRRRLHRPQRVDGIIDPEKLSEAVTESMNAMIQ